MKKTLLALLITIALFANLHARALKTQAYEGGKTTTDLTITSTTVNFSVSMMSFSCEGSAGDYAVILSSIQNSTSSKIYITPSKAFTSPDFTPDYVTFVGTSKVFEIDLQAGMTVYWNIWGKK